MSDKEAMERVAESFGISPFVLSMFIESYRKYKEVRFGPIELHDDSLSKFKDYIKEQRNLSHAIDSGATNQYEQMIELIDIYELEEVKE